MENHNTFRVSRCADGRQSVGKDTYMRDSFYINVSMIDILVDSNAKTLKTDS